MDESVRLGVLGPITASRGDEQVDLGPLKQSAVLAVLLLHANQPVSTDVIVDAVWAERPPEHGPNVVSKYVGRLRRLIDGPETPPDDGILRRVGPGYLARVDDSTFDLAEFTRRAAYARQLRRAGDRSGVRTELTAALGLWRGRPLAGLSGPFFDAARERLLEQRMTVLEERIEIDLACGAHAELIVELTGLVAEHPLREHLAGQLMRALYLSGRQADAFAVFHRLRARLRDQLGVDPGREITARYEQILRNEPGSPAAAHPRPPTEHAVPAQLRRDIPDFTGRTAESSELVGLLGDRTPPICAIDGIAGVGKTALVMHLAHRLADRFPDGQLYADLRGFTSDQPPLSPGDVLGQFLRALGVVPLRIPTEVDEQAALYRSTLTGRRVLVVLDNAVSPDQVRPLLPGTAGSLTLVTSRRSLGGLCVRDGAHRIVLGTLSPGEAAGLITRIVGERRVRAHPDAVAELAALCGHLPLALRIATQQLAIDPTLTLADLVAELAEERSRLDVLVTEGDDSSTVRAAFSWSYQALDPDTARAFRLLGLHATAEFGLPVAAALLGIDPGPTRKLLARLTSGHLLTENGRGRYQYHDLMRAYAAELADIEDTEAERDAARRRALTWYLRTADAAGTALVPYRQRPDLGVAATEYEPVSFESSELALEWYEVERINLVAAQRQAIDLGETAVGWQLPVTMWDFCYLRSRWTDWIETHELGLVAARADGDRVGEAGVLTSLGHAYLEVNRLADARTTAEQALRVWRDIGHRWGEGMALHIIASVHKSAGHATEAIEGYLRALAVHTEIDNRWGIGWSMAALGTTYRSVGEFDKALHSLLRATAIWREIGDPYGEGFALNDLGDTYLELDRFAEAVDHYQQAANLNREVGNQWSEAMALTGLGNAMLAMGKPDAATESWQAALTIFERLGDPRTEPVRDRLASLAAG